ncbi:MAG: zinc ribbon domain-containing protein [Parachlamydiales bacterium]|nr:zinc ribbon domain-containing protein [Parachlamydiales bacterium]
MPTYDYNCKACGKSCEFRQSITAEPITLCPHCHKDTLERGVGGGSAILRFTGSGFYITDYANPSKDDSEKCGCGKNKCEK